MPYKSRRIRSVVRFTGLYYIFPDRWGWKYLIMTCQIRNQNGDQPCCWWCQTTRANTMTGRIVWLPFDQYTFEIVTWASDLKCSSSLPFILFIFCEFFSSRNRMCQFGWKLGLFTWLTVTTLSDTHHVTLVTNLMISDVWRKDWIAIMTSRPISVVICDTDTP